MVDSSRVVVLGSGGQLATALEAVLPGEVIPLTRAVADLRDAEAVQRALDSAGAPVVINAAAYNLVDQAEREPELAYAVNALGPRTLAAWCEKNGATLVHISSDYVFGGSVLRSRPWVETDAPCPQGAYAVSKLAGEYFVSAGCTRHFILRTCGLYGAARKPGKRNFVETILKLSAERDELTIVNDQQCTPTSAHDLAVAIGQLAATTAYGLYHATNSGRATWFEFAREIVRLSGQRVRVRPISSSEYPTLARRPTDSVLDCGKLASVLGQPLQSWERALSDFLSTRES